VVWASASGSQIGTIGYTASKVVLAVGTQKIVKDLPAAFERIREYTYPREDARARVAYGVPSSLNQTFVMSKVSGWTPGRVHIVLITENVGF